MLYIENEMGDLTADEFRRSVHQQLRHHRSLLAELRRLVAAARTRL